MVRQQSFPFDDNKFDSATKDFLLSKRNNIKSLMKPGFQKGCTALYEIGEQLYDVQDKLVKKEHFVSWLDNEFLNLEEFGRRKIKLGTAYDYMKLYKYASKFLENPAGAEPDLLVPSVLYLLGKKNTPNNIKQEFAARINSGDKILWKEVKEAIDRECPEKIKTRNSSTGLSLSINLNRIYDLEIAVIKLKELLDNEDKKESKYQALLQQYPRLLGYNYQIIERHKNLDERYIPDFTGVRFRDYHRDIIEIKQPFTTLFRKDEEFSHEFNKAWNQVEGYLSFARRNKEYLQGKRLSFDNPECYLIIGYHLSRTQLDKIKIKESNNLAIKVLTYDNLISVAEGIINSSKK